MQITSRHNPKLKHAASLRNRRNRDRHAATLVDGVREISRVAIAGGQLVELFMCDALLAEHELQLLDQIAPNVDRYEIDRELFARLAYGDRYDGAIAVVATRTPELHELSLPARPLIAVVESIEKPGNLGAILRSADGAGFDAVVVADPVIDLWNPNTIRASVGTVFHRRVAVATAEATRQWLVDLHLPMYAAQPEASVDYTSASFLDGGAIVLGSEAHGLSPVWQHAAVTPISLPMLGVGDSLNVSVTAAVLMYEARRQRTASDSSAKR
jgi:TrmH family RNA methyltransferase